MGIAGFSKKYFALDRGFKPGWARKVIRRRAWSGKLNHIIAANFARLWKKINPKQIKMEDEDGGKRSADRVETNCTVSRSFRAIDTGIQGTALKRRPYILQAKEIREKMRLCLVWRFEGMVKEANVGPKVYRMNSIEKRISGLQSKVRGNASVDNLQEPKGPRSKSGGPAGDSQAEDLGRLPQQSRQRALREDSHETPKL